MKLSSLIRRHIAPLVVACCFVFIGSQPAPAQTLKPDPFGTNNPPPAGAILDLSGTPIPTVSGSYGTYGAYQKYTVSFTATLANTAITFAFREDPARVSFANASVTDLTTPSGNLLVNGDFSQGPVGSNTPIGWTYANVFGVLAGGSVFSGNPNGFIHCLPYNFCWNDGAVQGFDAISQTIATTVGHTYQITFFVSDNSGCSTGLAPIVPCNFSDISTNGDTADQFGNGIDVAVYAQAGLPIPAGGALWLGNDTAGDVFETNTSGTVITTLTGPDGTSLPTTGIAWDGSHLFFADVSGNYTKRTADGKTVLENFVVAASGGEDLAWDSKRGVLWRIQHSNNTLQKIDPVAHTVLASYFIPQADPTLGTLGGLGVAYDSTRDELDVSFCQVGCGPINDGLVDRVSPNDGSVIGPLFRTTGFRTGGLAYDPSTDTLWVGDFGVVRHMDRSGNVLSTFNRPTPGGFVDGLEFVSGSSGVQSSDPNFTPSKLASGLSGPSGLVSRDDLIVSQFGTGQVSLVNATSGAVSPFASQTAPNRVAFRSSDGLVAVETQSTGQIAGPIDFYNSSGTLLASIPAGNPNACIGGLAFDANGNLLVAAGPGTTVPGRCQSTGWALYKFPQQSGQMTPSTTASQVAPFNNGDVIAGVAFSAAPLPDGTAYAASSTNGNIYSIPLGGALTTPPTAIATVPTTVNESGNPVPDISDIAIDPLTGYIYISESLGTNVVRIPPGGGSPIVFATGFNNSFGLGFDSMGDLFVNDFNAGVTWKFKRKSTAPPPQPVTQGQQNNLSFTDPNGNGSQNTIIPASALLNGTTSVRTVFFTVDPATLDTTLLPGSTPNPRFGDQGVPPGTRSFPTTSDGKVVVAVQQCFTNGVLQPICLVQEPLTSSDLITLTFHWTGSLPANLGFVISTDTLSDYTLITTSISVDPTGGGGTRGLCSKTFIVNLPAPDFFLGPVSPITMILGSSANTTVTVNSSGNFTSQVTLTEPGLPAGLSPSFSPNPVSPAGGSVSSTLTVTAGPSVTPSTNLGTVTGTSGLLSHTTPASVTVIATTAGITNVIGELLAGGCIDNAGIANALTSKLSAAQSAVGGGQIQTAINILTAFKNQVQAQAGKHIATSCTIGGVTFYPVTVLLTDAQSLIDSLRTTLSADPITGFVVDSTGAGVAGATVSLLNSASNTVIETATTDITGFYYFAKTSTLTMNLNCTVQVTGLAGFTASTPAQTFTWVGTRMAFNFSLN
jgi:Carboxypeptidase regulatory-like domain